MDLVKARAEARQRKQSYLSRVDAWAAEHLGSAVLQQDRAQRLAPATLGALRRSGFLALELGEYLPDTDASRMLPDQPGIEGVAAAIRGLSRTDPAVAVLVHVHNALAVRCLLRFGSADQKAAWLPRLARDTVGAFAATEPQAGSDLAMMEARLDPAEDGSYRLTADKHWITNAAEAGLFLVFARLGHGSACALVPADAPGVRVGARLDKMSMRASSTCPVHFEDVRVAAEDLLGGKGSGMDVAMYGLVSGRIGIAAQMLGLAEGAHRRAVAYARSRSAFGKPILDHQAVAFPLAQVHAEMLGVEQTILAAARKLDRATAFMGAMELANAAKLLAAQLAQRAAGLAVETLGGNGVAESHEVEKFYRDAKVGQIYEGTDNILLRAISARFGGGGAP